MKKKILAICVVGMFLVTGLTSVTALSVEEKVNDTSEENDNNNARDLVEANIIVDHLNSRVYAWIHQPVKTSKGDYRGWYTVDFHDIPSGYRCVGAWHVEAHAGNIKFFDESRPFDYTCGNTPKDIVAEDTEVIKYVSSDFLGINVLVQCSVDTTTYYLDDPDPWSYKHDEKNEEQWTTFTKDKCI